eukprot:COSAG02_NODE_344_length_24146_cov_12.795983_5_plen_60_part_00
MLPSLHARGRGGSGQQLAALPVALAGCWASIRIYGESRKKGVRVSSVLETQKEARKPLF